jgi:hypothetical protein
LSWDYNFWYKTTLFSATQIALLTGCEAFAAGFITDGPRSVFVLRSLAKFYTHFFVNGYTHRFKLITNTILDIFLSVSIAPFGGDKNALLHCLPWVAVAFLQHSCATAEESGAAIAKLAVLISGGYNNYAIESFRLYKGLMSVINQMTWVIMTWLCLRNHHEGKKSRTPSVG